MVRGPRKHMKRVAAPKHWMLDKLGGCYAPRPSSGPHKLRECLPLALFLRNRLKYALNYTEVKKILAQRLVKVDGRVRTDHTYPSGFMDVIAMEKSGENFRLIYDVKGRYKVSVCARVRRREDRFERYLSFKMKMGNSESFVIDGLVKYEIICICRLGASHLGGGSRLQALRCQEGLGRTQRDSLSHHHRRSHHQVCRKRNCEIKCKTNAEM